MTTDEDLIRRALEARLYAYAPYSSFPVGAALLGKSGRVFAGCNVENISFGLTMCAERVAIGDAVQGGEKEFEALAVVSDSAEPVVPCGACRQVLAEFNPAVRVISSTLAGKVEVFSLLDLFPNPSQGILR